MKSKPKFLRNQKPLSSQSLSKNSSFSKRKTPPFVGKKNNHQQSTNKSSHLPTFNNKVAHNPLQLQKISDLVIDLLTNDPKPIPGNVLFQKTIREIKNWGHNTFLKINDFYLVIDQLLAKKIIRKNIRDKYYLTYPNYPLLNEQTYQGTFQVGRGDFGFINYDEKQDDGKIVSHTYFVHKNNFDQAIDGDLVEFVLLDTSANFKKLGKNNDAKIIKVISHAKDFYVGEVVVNNDDPLVDQKYYVVLDNPKVNAKVTITNPLGLVAGHKVLVKINQFIPNNFRGEVIKIIGHKNDLGVDISSIVYDFGLNIDFTTEVIAESEQLLTDQKRFLTDPIRQDLTHIPFITIDPITSKDFDDAIFVSKQANHFLLQVAVADVSTYVKPQSALDQTAYQRGTSVYLLNSVIPMLPHLISDDLCSLLPNAVRCALVVTMEINFQGKVNWKSVTIQPAIIKSYRRFTYDEVNQYFQKTNDLTNDLPIIKTVLDDGYQLFFLTQKEKQQRGSINFELPEIQVIVDQQNKPTDVTFYHRWHAQMMIEDFMVAANEGVAYFMEQQNLATIYRVHDKPQIEPLKEFALRAKTLDFNVTTKITNDLSCKTIAAWLLANPNLTHKRIVHMMLLRCMAKAIYHAENLYHFGLASKHYLHFTSPIRRYPDLVVHQLLWMFVFAPQNYTTLQRNNLVSNLGQIAQYCSQTENLACEVERAVSNYKLCEYMGNYLGQTFSGIVVNLNNKGFYVQLNNGIEGFTLLFNSPLDFFEFNYDHYYLVGKNTGQKITLGTKVIVKLVKTDLKQRTIEFALEQIVSHS